MPWHPMEANQNLSLQMPRAYKIKTWWLPITNSQWGCKSQPISSIFTLLLLFSIKVSPGSCVWSPNYFLFAARMKSNLAQIKSYLLTTAACREFNWVAQKLKLWKILPLIFSLGPRGVPWSAALCPDCYSCLCLHSGLSAHNHWLLKETPAQNLNEPLNSPPSTPPPIPTICYKLLALCIKLT